MAGVRSVRNDWMVKKMIYIEKMRTIYIGIRHENIPVSKGTDFKLIIVVDADRRDIHERKD